MTSVTLERGKILRVVGPCSVKVVKGKVLMNGAELGEGASFVVPRDRVYAILAVSDSTIEASAGALGKVEVAAPGEEVVEEWFRLAEEVVESSRTVVVVGEVDSGKSTMCLWLCNRALAKGKKPCIIDGDVGQNDLYVPGTVAAAVPREPVLNPRCLAPVDAEFVGSYRPAGLTHRLKSGIIKLVERCRRNFSTDFTIVNTDGWVTGEGIEAKAEIINALSADTVVVMSGRVHDPKVIAAELSTRCSARIVIAKTPPAAPKRSREERRVHRQLLYSKYLPRGDDLMVQLDKVVLEPAYSKERCSRGRLEPGTVYVGRCGRDKVVVYVRPKRFGGEVTYSYTVKDLKKLLVGLYRGDEFIGAATIEDIDIVFRVIKLKVARVRDGEPDRIVLGTIKVE